MRRRLASYPRTVNWTIIYSSLLSGLASTGSAAQLWARMGRGRVRIVEVAGSKHDMQVQILPSGSKCEVMPLAKVFLL